MENQLDTQRTFSWQIENDRLLRMLNIAERRYNKGPMGGDIEESEKTRIRRLVSKLNRSVDSLISSQLPLELEASEESGKLNDFGAFSYVWSIPSELSVFDSTRHELLQNAKKNRVWKPAVYSVLHMNPNPYGIKMEFNEKNNTIDFSVTTTTLAGPVDTILADTTIDNVQYRIDRVNLNQRKKVTLQGSARNQEEFDYVLNGTTKLLDTLSAYVRKPIKIL